MIPKTVQKTEHKAKHEDMFPFIGGNDFISYFAAPDQFQIYLTFLLNTVRFYRVDYLATHSYSGCVDCDVGYLWDLYNRYSRIFSRIDLKRNSFIKFIF
jgi:hypothetical protein